MRSLWPRRRGHVRKIQLPLPTPSEPHGNCIIAQVVAAQHASLIHPAPNPMPVLAFGMIIVANQEPVFDIQGPGEILAKLEGLVIADAPVIWMKRNRIVQDRFTDIWAHE